MKEGVNMIIKMFNGWYFFWIFISIATYIGLYFLLRNKKLKTQKITLFSLLIFALALHFLKCLFPPYSNNINILYREIWFINICGANIFLFVFIYISKSSTWKDYMFYLGILGGALALLYPIEPIEKDNQVAEFLDIIRFYIHHILLWVIPLLMVHLGHHKLSYKNVWKVPGCLLLVFLFIILNQIFQSELGFTGLRNNDFLNINYKNTSYIWEPKDDFISKALASLCPKFFKTVPVGEFAGEPKYWPWFWLIIPSHIIFIPICFLMSLIFDFKSFKEDMKKLFNRIKTILCHSH